MTAIAPPHEVAVPPIDVTRLRPLVGDDRYEHLVHEAARTSAALAGGTVWNVNSTAAGGGVAEMLQVLVGYSLGLGLSVRWLVIGGEPSFFALTKRLHNRLHGAAGDDGHLGAAEATLYESVAAANATAITEHVRPGDVVLLHDPQTAGMATALAAAGATVLWRCHIGTDTANELSESAWQFLHPYLMDCAGYVFTRASYVPTWVPQQRVAIIPPSIDPFSPKNQELSPAASAAILRAIGVIDGDASGDAVFIRRDGSGGQVRRVASVVGDGPLDPDAALVIQVSRWDRLKDMAGVMTGFSEFVATRHDAQLALVGPAVAEVSDDPDGGEVLSECVEMWRALPAAQRRRIRLITLPMDDVDENAAMVNALQRRATVVVQKSLAEGFGLTVAEAMWKARPVVASAVGGIVDQIADGTGVLLPDPTDLRAFADSVVTLLDRPGHALELGEGARRHVVDHFLGDQHLVHYGELIERVTRGTEPRRPAVDDASP